MADRAARSFDRLLEQWLQGYRSPNTRSAYRRDLEVFATWARGSDTKPLRVRPDDVGRLAADLARGGASARTVQRRISSLSSFFAFAVAAGVRDDNPVSRAGRSQVATPSATVCLDGHDCAAVWRAASAIGPRTSTLVGLLLLDGVKLNEALALDLEDVRAHGRRVEVAVERHGWAQSIRLHPRTAGALLTYRSGRRRGPLLLGEAVARRPGRLTRHGAHYLLGLVGERAGLDERLTANRLRGSHIANAHAAGVPVARIQHQVGHADGRTTRRHLPADAP